MTSLDSLALAFDELKITGAAREWLLVMYDVTQTMDDIYDGDKVSKESLISMIWNALVGLPGNPFFIQNSHLLIPVVSLAILKWQAANSAESEGKADAKSYMWRAAYYELVLLVVQILHGTSIATSHAKAILSLYGEDYESYMKEFKNA